MRHGFRAKQWVPFSSEEVFAFFANPANLPPLMPPWQRARLEEAKLVAPPSPLPGVSPLQCAAGLGSRISISFRPIPLLPLRLPWDAVIVDFEWNQTFCDEQRPRGPFQYWRHRHTVIPEERDGCAGTCVADRLEYELPFGGLGDIANTLFVSRQIRGIFAYRQRRLLELLGAPIPAMV